MENYGEMLDDTTIRFERMLPGPIERVWEYITESDKRAKWLCAGDTRLEVGGSVEMRFEHATLASTGDIERPEKYRDMPSIVTFGGRVTEVEPPRLLVHTWEFEGENSEVRYELEEHGDQVRLVLTHRRLNSMNEVLSVSAGWHTHLEILRDVLDGEVPEPFWKAHTKYEALYEDRLEL